MNLYNYHNKPETLHRHKDSEDIVPNIIYARIINELPLNKKQMEVIKHNPHLALEYAIHIIKSRWPEGEGTIMSNLEVANSYEVFLSEIGYTDEDKPRRYRRRVY